MKWPGKKYKTIYADPPWPERGGGKIGSKALTGWLLANGLKEGRYNLKAIKGGYMGVPE
jgi:hypothetical protein